MDVKAALNSQYTYGLSMLCECIERCPEDLWLDGRHPRTFWRIAYHAAYYTHRYLQESSTKCQVWSKHQKRAAELWGRPPLDPPYSRQELLDFIGEIICQLGGLIEASTLDSPKSGFPLYKMSKFELHLVNLRHLQGHVGQLSELLMARGIEVEWAGMS